MPTDAKRQAVTELTELLRGSSALAVADYRGLTVSEMHTVRRSLRSNGVSLKIAKNRLLKIAADEAGLDELKPLLEGPTAVATTEGDEVNLARALQEAFRPYKVVTIRGGLLAGQPISAADLGRLATLPSREVLLGRLAGGMIAPLSGMAAVLAGNLRNLVGVLNAVADQKRTTEPAAAEVAPEPADSAAPEAPASEAVATEDATAEAVAPDDATAEAVAPDDAATSAATAPGDEAESAADEAPVDDQEATEAATPAAEAEGGDDAASPETDPTTD